MSEGKADFTYHAQAEIEVYINQAGTISIRENDGYMPDLNQLIMLNDDAARFVVSSIEKCLAEKNRT